MKTTQDRASVPSLTPKQVEELRSLLVAKREELLEKLRAHERGERETEADPSDEATNETIEQEESGLTDIEARLLAEVEHALEKLDRRTYGISESSGEPIGYARLRVVPWARLTVEEEERRERQARQS